MKKGVLYFLPEHNILVIGTGRSGTVDGDMYWFEFECGDEWLVRVKCVDEIGFIAEDVNNFV